MIDQGMLYLLEETQRGPPNFDQMTARKKKWSSLNLMQQGDPLAGCKRQAETLKGTIKTDLEGITSTLEDTVDEEGNVVKGSISQYEKEAKRTETKK
jgi:hypothetical protein